MEAVVQCPVCTLFLHPGMSLEDHLNTHPKDQVIQALTQLTLQRANILSSGTQFTPKPTSPPPIATETTSSPIFSSNNNTNTSNNNNNNNGSNLGRKETAVVIQVQASQATPSITTPPQSATQPHLFNNQSSISYVHESQKNVMIVNSCSTQFIQQRIANNNVAPPQKRQISIGYDDQAGPSNIHVIPRYTSERYSGPPPPYSTAISSTSFNNSTTLARDNFAICRDESSSSSSSYEVKAHYTEKEDGNFLVTEIPQKVVEYSEDENGVLTLSEKIVKSPPRVLEYSMKEQNILDDNEELKDDEVQEATDRSYDEHPVLSEKVEALTMESCDEFTLIKNKKKTTHGLKVLSNVKITTDMISPGIQEMLLNKKGRRTSKILNKRPQQEDMSPSPPLQIEIDEVMDLTRPSASFTQKTSTSIDLDAPSTSRQQRYEMDSYIEQFEITELSSEDALEQAGIIDQDEPVHISSPPLSATPTSVIRTIGQESNAANTNFCDGYRSPTFETMVKHEKLTKNKSLPFIVSPKPSTSSQDSHLNAGSDQEPCPFGLLQSGSSVKIGKPIVQKPKKLTLKLKKSTNNNSTVSEVHQNIKLEPEIDNTDIESSELSSCTIKMEKVDANVSKMTNTYTFLVYFFLIPLSYLKINKKIPNKISLINFF